jgi:hypothetical protein
MGGTIFFKMQKTKSMGFYCNAIKPKKKDKS